MLDADQLAEFQRSGIVKIAGAFSAEAAGRMRDRVWTEIERRHGILRDDPATWEGSSPTGLQGCKKDSAFKPVLGPPVSAALDQLLGAWQHPKHYGQVLVTLPNASTWRVPHRLWHPDFAFDAPPAPLFALKYWALLDHVEPGGGGTPQIAGSQALVARYLSERPADDREYKSVRDGFMRSDPWLCALATADDEPDRNARFMRNDTELDGMPARVVELTGDGGDVWLTHPWVFHTIAPNATRRPRMMQTKAIYASVTSP